MLEANIRRFAGKVRGVNLAEEIRLEEGYMIAEKTAALTEHELHTHYALEVGIVVDQRIRFKTTRREFEGQAGDIFLYRPFEPHWTLIEPGRPPARWIMLLFSPSIVSGLPDGEKLLTPFYAMGAVPLIPSNAEPARAIRAAAELALLEQTERKPGWKTRRYVHFIDALVLIHRYYADTVSTGAQGRTVSVVERVIAHMLLHLGDDIDADELMRMTDMGKSQFYLAFREMTGLSPNQFLLRLRLQQAAYLLQHSDRSITEIAYECGFGSPSYFNRRFKEYDGRSPSDHRRLFASGGS